jgi:hypothetical protein
VFDRVLRRLREKIRRREYVMTTHAEEEMDDDGLTILDIESSVLTGRSVERQRDVRTREWKYVVVGAAVDGRPVGAVGKLSPTDRLVIITTYRE